MVVIRRTAEFEKEANKLFSTSQKRQLLSAYQRLTKNPWLGDALGPAWFRELRFQEKRAYFFVDAPLVLFFAVSDKKRQQSVIDATRDRIQMYKEYLDAVKREL